MKSGTFEKRATSMISIVWEFLYIRFVASYEEKLDMQRLIAAKIIVRTFQMCRYATDVTFQRSYGVLGSIATEGNTFKPYKFAIDTCSGHNLVRKADIPLDGTSCVVRGAPLTRLAGANSNPLNLTAVVWLALWLRITFRIPFVVADQPAVPVIIGTAFITAHV